MRSPSFSRELLDAVRSDHITLNKLITSRLPLCLPPHTNSPLLYMRGLVTFGLIYEVFEEQLAKELLSHTSKDPGSNAFSFLDIPGLRRRDRIRQDVDEIHLRLSDEPFRQCDKLPTQGMRIFDELSDHVAEKPHLILAHAWAMYLAIFNGGRWIRGQLRDAGEGFWMGLPPLSFWEFEGDQDGDDVHRQFKENFEVAARQLTYEEWVDVVQEVPKVFGLCSRLVERLDGIQGGGGPKTKSVLKADKASSLQASLCSAFGYIGIASLLGLAWPILLQAYTSWKAEMAPVVQTNGVGAERYG